MAVIPLPKNFELKAELIRTFGTQERAAIKMKIDETKLSKIIRRVRKPHDGDLEKFKKYLGAETVARCFPETRR